MNTITTAYKHCWLQYVATLAATISLFISGMHFVWTSPSLPKLQSNTSLIHITEEEGSWLASISLIAELPVSPVAAWVSDSFGRKFAILFTAIPYLCSWLLIAFAQSLPMLLIARIIVGIGDGFTWTVMPMYIGEIAQDSIRGQLGNLITAMLDVGCLFVYCVGPFVSVRDLALISSVVPLIMFVVFSFMPESPYYLIKIGQFSRGRRSLQRLRHTPNVDEEFDAMKASVGVQMKKSSKYAELLNNRKALTILLVLKTIQQLSGIAAFLAYTETIFDDSDGILSPELSAIVFAIVQFLSSFLSVFFVDSYGRKPLLISSCLGCAVTLAIQAGYLYVQEFALLDLTYLSWIPLSTMMMYIFVFNYGLGTIPMTIPGEIFPTNIKGKAMCVSDIYLAFAEFLVVKTFRTLSGFGVYVPFFLYACCSFVSVFYIVYCVPETRGKSLDEIQVMLNGKSPTKK